MSAVLLRQSAKAARNPTRLSALFSTSSSRKDLVQNLYVKEIKAYKAPPVAQDAHVGVVRSYSQPPKPQAPALPTDLASELAAYDAAEPTQADAVAPTSTEDGGAGAEAYLAFLEEDLPKKVDHHH